MLRVTGPQLREVQVIHCNRQVLLHGSYRHV